MNAELTDFGHRYITEQIKNNISINTDNEILLDILSNKIVKLSHLPKNHENLLLNGFIKLSNANNLLLTQFNYRTNPLEHVNRLVLELTTNCNFNCSHCRNGYLQKTTETDTDKLKNIISVFNLLNIKRFDFIGGEVTKYANNWLDLANYANMHKNKIVTVYTNGWWADATNFTAAGKFYANDVEYLNDLKQHGVTHILFSIDGDAEYHNKSRNQNNLYERILCSFKKIKQAGIKPRISGIIKGSLTAKTVAAYADIATIMYDLPASINTDMRMEILMLDDTNHFSNFIDIGNGVAIRENKYKISAINPKHIRCKAFFRPMPGLRITAGGNLSVCPLLDAGEDYGNIHQTNITELLNNFRNSFSYKIHAEKRIGDYIKYLDTSVFGQYFDHICSVRTIVTLLAREINSTKNITQENIYSLNKKIAAYSGHGALND